MIRKMLLCMSAACMAMTSVKADKLDLLKVAEFRVGTEYCTSSDSLNYIFTIKSDSVLVDEIVLAVENNTKLPFEVKEGECSLFKYNVKKNMTTSEMKDKTFTLKVGHRYEITWGTRATWLVSLIKKQPEVADLMVLNDSTIQIKKQEDLLNKTGQAFILNDSLTTISSIGFDEQYMGDSLIIAVAGKDSIHMVYEGKIVKFAKPFELLKSQNYAFILKTKDQVKSFDIGESKKTAFPMLWIIGAVIVLVIMIVAVFFFLLIRKRAKTGHALEETNEGKCLEELIGERLGFDLTNKQTSMDELKRMLYEYDVVKKLYFELELEDDNLKGKGLKEKFEEIFNNYKSLQQTKTNAEKKSESVVVEPNERSFAERLKCISKDDNLVINHFVLNQLENIGFKDINCDKIQYTDYLRNIVEQLAKKSDDEHTLRTKIEDEVRSSLKLQGLDMNSFGDEDVKKALESIFLKRLNAANFEGTTVEDIFKKVKDQEAQLNNTIKEIRDEIQGKVRKIEDNQETIRGNEEKIANLNKKIDSMKGQLINLFSNDLGALKKACNDVFLNPCTNTSDADCMVVENNFLNHLKEGIGQLEEVTLTEKQPADCYREFQCILEAELKNVDSAFNAVCRYYAYSCIPFMADDIEYGKKFRRNAMFKLFLALDKLLIDFGLQVIIPHLFTDTLADGKDLYEDYTGQKDAYSDLNNLCPNVKYRKEYVDYTDKSRLIYDIITVGYSINGQIIQKAKVLI